MYGAVYDIRCKNLDHKDLKLYVNDRIRYCIRSHFFFTISYTISQGVCDIVYDIARGMRYFQVGSTICDYVKYDIVYDIVYDNYVKYDIVYDIVYDMFLRCNKYLLHDV